MHFRILKMTATSGFLAAAECTKFVFGRGSAPDPAGGAYSAPNPLTWLKGPTSKKKERGREGRGRRGREGRVNEKRGGIGGEERGGEGRGTSPLYANSWICH